MEEEHFGASEGFLRDDIRVGKSARHLFFASDEQLEILSSCKRWYLDGTFRLVKKPFMQLFSIHGFVKNSKGEVKQLPLGYVLMSRRQRRDYVAVFKSIKLILTKKGLPISILEVVADFERACWRAVEDIFPTVKIFGCGFHWTQAVFRRLKKLGLVSIYHLHAPTRMLCKQMMSLHLIPHQKIKSNFEALAAQIVRLEIPRLESDKLLQFKAYMEDQWIENSFWTPSRWSVFMQDIRTNNYTEGWHFRLNSMANTVGMNFYDLIPLLWGEADLIPMEMELLCREMGSRRTRLEYSELQDLLFNYWDSYNAGVDSSAELLQSCAKLYLEFNKVKYDKDLDDDREEELEVEDLNDTDGL